MILRMVLWPTYFMTNITTGSTSFTHGIFTTGFTSDLFYNSRVIYFTTECEMALFMAKVMTDSYLTTKTMTNFNVSTEFTKL